MKRQHRHQPRQVPTPLGPCTYRPVGRTRDEWAVFDPNNRRLGTIYRIGARFEASNTARPYGNVKEAVVGMATRAQLPADDAPSYFDFSATLMRAQYQGVK